MTENPAMNAAASALSDEDFERLADALVPTPLPPERSDALRGRVLDRVRADRAPDHAARFVTVPPRPADAWQPMFPGIELRLLHDHGAEQSFLLRMKAGARVPGHGHNGEELCVVVEGTVRLNDVVGTPGTFHLALPGSEHRVIEALTDCVLFLRANLDSGFRFHAS